MKRKHPFNSARGSGRRREHTFPRRHFGGRVSAALAAAILLVLPLQLCASNFFVAVYICEHGNQSNQCRRVTFTSNGWENPGPSVLSVAGSCTRVTRENNDDGSLREVRTANVSVLIGPNEEAWATADPNAFTIYVRDVNERLYHTRTIALLEEDGDPLFVEKWTYHGDTREIGGGRIQEHGSVIRTEMRETTPGLFVTLSGPETDDGFLPLERSSEIHYQDNPMQRLVREIHETRADPESPWETTSDVVTESERMAARWVTTRRVFEPDGRAAIAEWEYYEPGDVAGPDGMIAEGTLDKRLRRADGSEVFHQYLKNHGSIVERRNPNGPDRRETRTQTTGIAYRNEVIRPGGGRSEGTGQVEYTTTRIWEEDGVETRRETIHYGRDRNTSTIRVPGHEDQVSIIERPFHENAEPGFRARQIFEDGTIWTLTVDLDDDGLVRRVFESGRHENEVIVEGERVITILPADSDSGPAETITETIPG